MNAIIQNQITPVVRSHLDFKLNEIPRFWFGGDPFITRMFDALSLTFPDGERYFIQSASRTLFAKKRNMVLPMII